MDRHFPRSLDALDAIFAFTGEFFDREDVPADHRPAVDFAIEEIFTNLVKYQPGGGAEVLLALARSDDVLTVTVTDEGVTAFDPTRAVDAPVDRPLDERSPGGLGLYLTRRLMDGIAYEYRDRTSIVTMTKRLRGPDVRDQAR